MEDIPKYVGVSRNDISNLLANIRKGVCVFIHACVQIIYEKDKNKMTSLSKNVSNLEKLDKERGMSHYFCRFGSNLKSHKNKAILRH